MHGLVGQKGNLCKLNDFGCRPREAAASNAAIMWSSPRAICWCAAGDCPFGVSCREPAARRQQGSSSRAHDGTLDPHASLADVSVRRAGSGSDRQACPGKASRAAALALLDACSVERESCRATGVTGRRNLSC